MGKYFMMSFRFNKKAALDFGLIPYGEDIAINPNDKSTWTRLSLYDFGWGEENGYYKSPLPEWNTLLNLVMHSSDREDVYGAAAVILKRYPDELLCLCESMAEDRKMKNQFLKFVEVFNLRRAINRSPIIGKTCVQIQSDFERWEKIAKIAHRQLKR